MIDVETSEICRALYLAHPRQLPSFPDFAWRWWNRLL